MTTKRPSSEEAPHCSFCRKNQDAVGKLISSPGDFPRAYICDECVAICNSILEDKRSEDLPTSPSLPDRPISRPFSTNMWWGRKKPRKNWP